MTTDMLWRQAAALEDAMRSVSAIYDRRKLERNGEPSPNDDEQRARLSFLRQQARTLTEGLAALNREIGAP